MDNDIDISKTLEGLNAEADAVIAQIHTEDASIPLLKAAAARLDEIQERLRLLGQVAQERLASETAKFAEFPPEVQEAALEAHKQAKIKAAIEHFNETGEIL